MKTLKMAPGLDLPLRSTSLSAIVRLCRRGGPPAVLRSVRTIVVDAVDRVQAARPGAHVRVEGLEAVAPAFAHGDAAAAPIRVVRRSWIQAAVLQPLPCVELRSRGQPVRPVCGRRALALQAATRLNLLPQVVLPDDSRAPAVTLAAPHPVTRRRARRLIEDDQTAEALADQANTTRTHPAHSITGICDLWGV